MQWQDCTEHPHLSASSISCSGSTMGLQGRPSPRTCMDSQHALSCPETPASPQGSALAGLTLSYQTSLPAQEVNGSPKWKEVGKKEKEPWRVLPVPSCNRTVSRAERGKPSLGNHTQASLGETRPLPLRRTSWEQRSTGPGASAPICPPPATPQ